MPGLVEALTTRSKLQREWAMKVVADLDEDQLAWRPAPDAHNIAWTLWHIARADDNVVRDLTGRSIWTDGDYLVRWGLSSDRINRMSDEEAARLSLPGRDALLGYVREVFAATDAAVGAVDASRAAEEIESGFVGRRITVGELCVFLVSHDGRHLGEMEYIKGLQGVAGSATI